MQHHAYHELETSEWPRFATIVRWHTISTSENVRVEAKVKLSI